MRSELAKTAGRRKASGARVHCETGRKVYDEERGREDGAVIAQGWGRKEGELVEDDEREGVERVPTEPSSEPHQLQANEKRKLT